MPKVKEFTGVFKEEKHTVKCVVEEPTSDGSKPPKKKVVPIQQSYDIQVVRPTERGRSLVFLHAQSRDHNIIKWRSIIAVFMLLLIIAIISVAATMTNRKKKADADSLNKADAQFGESIEFIETMDVSTDGSPSVSAGVTTKVNSVVTTDVRPDVTTKVNTVVSIKVSTVVSACKNISCAPGLCRLIATRAMCECPDGYIFDPKRNGSKCKDIDECAQKPPLCNIDTSTCQNTGGSFTCICQEGFAKTNGGDQCVDIDECASEEHECELSASTCINLAGIYLCQCLEGYEGSTVDKKKCHDIDECATNKTVCEPSTSVCMNVAGTYICPCLNGYTEDSDDNTRCIDVDECNVEMHDCEPQSSFCYNTMGAYECFCRNGYRQISRTECIDLDECTLGLHDCDPSTTMCYNIAGSFDCDCLAGYIDNGDRTCSAPCGGHGYSVTIGEKGVWPWQAEVLVDNRMSCGAVVIDDQWVATARTCFTQLADQLLNIQRVGIRIGTTTYPIAMLQSHDTKPIHGLQQGDFTLLKLGQKDAPKLDASVQPTCLPRFLASTPFVTCYVSGWGSLENPKAPKSSIQTSAVTVVDVAYCNDALKKELGVKEDVVDDNYMICARHADSYSSLCMTDIGGPLVCKESGREWTLYGVTSYGKRCSSFLVFTKISTYMDWIKKKLNA